MFIHIFVIIFEGTERTLYFLLLIIYYYCCCFLFIYFVKEQKWHLIIYSIKIIIFLSFKFVQAYPDFLGKVSTFNVMRPSWAEMMGCQIIHIMQHFKNLRPVGADDKLQRRAGVDVLAHLGSETEFGSVQIPVMQVYVSILLIPYLSTAILPIPISQQQLSIKILFCLFSNF